MQVRSVPGAPLHFFQHVDFGAPRAETLYDRAFVGGNDIGRNVMVHPVVNADLQDDDVLPGATAPSRRARTPAVVSPFMPWFVTVTRWPLALNAASN